MLILVACWICEIIFQDFKRKLFILSSCVIISIIFILLMSETTGFYSCIDLMLILYLLKVKFFMLILVACWICEINFQDFKRKLFILSSCVIISIIFILLMSETTGFYSCIDVIGIMTNSPIYECNYYMTSNTLYSKNFLCVKGFI